jgi:hypothetical protein
VSIQVAILKILASHDSGRATHESLKRDIVILTTSGPDWSARIRRLAGRVQSIDIFGSGYVIRDDDGWEITVDGRDFLQMLEAVTQDNRLVDAIEPASHDDEGSEYPRGALIVVGHRFKNQKRRSAAPALPSSIARSSEG